MTSIRMALLLLVLLGAGCNRGADWTSTAFAASTAEPASPEVLALVEALGDDERREEAIEGLAAIGGPAVPAVIGIIDDNDPKSSGYALRILTEIGEPAVPYLAKALGDPQLSVRYISVRVLRTLKEDAAAAVPALIEALKKESGISREASQSLGDIGEAAVEPLIRVMDGNDEYVRPLAAESLLLNCVDDIQAVPLWTKLLKDRNPEVRREAALALRLVTPTQEATAAIPGLVHALEDTSFEVRMYAARALGAAGPDAKMAVPALSKLLKDQHPSVRSHAAGALGDLGPIAQSAVPALLEASRTSDTSFRHFIAEALQKIDPAAAEAALN